MSWQTEINRHWRFDFDPQLCHLRSIHLTISWYGALFALGLIISHQLFGKLWRERRANQLAEMAQPGISAHWQERLFTWIYLSILLGARLGEVFFYEWSYYRFNLWEIPKIWRGGLSSHGALLGIIIAVCSFVRFYLHDLSFSRLKVQTLELFDLLALTACPCMVLIRIGNFLNQEILGTPSNAPWAVIFLSPKDGSAAISRHPVQLYEAGAYLAIGLALWTLRKASLFAKGGRIFGSFLASVFFMRIAFECFKAPFASELPHQLMRKGQILSLAPLMIGLFLLFRSRDDR